MSNPVASILRAASRRPNEPLNVLTCPTHERFESNLCSTQHNFYAVRTPQVKDWNQDYAPVPENYVLLNPDRGERQLPLEVDFDLALSQNKFGQFQILANLSRRLHLPLLSLEHTLPHPSWSPQKMAALKAMRGHANVFISDFSRRAWGWGQDEACVVHHGVDVELFRPDDNAQVRTHVLSVVNDFRNRDWCCGHRFWEEATSGLPRLHLGSSPDGWSRPAESIEDLVRHYQEAAVFVDTASASPIPTVVLEAMACGMVVISRGNAMTPEVIEDGVNGFICVDPDSMQTRLREVLERPELYQGVRRAARNTIVSRFSLERFVRDWDRVLRSAANVVYEGKP